MSQEDKSEQNKEEEEIQEKNENQTNEKENENIENNDSKNILISKINDMNTKLLNSKNNFMEKLNKLVSDINQNYDKYISDINKASNDLINDTSKNEDNYQQYLFNLENIFDNIEELQNSILENNDNLNNFFTKNDSDKNKKVKKGNEKILKINCNSDIIESQKSLEPENLEKIEKIIIKEISSDILEEIFTGNNNENKKYKDIIIKKCNLENVNLSQIFPSVNKFKLKKCQISFDSKGFFNFQNINELYLENIGLVNESFNSILTDLKNNINFITNIKVFSVKNNNISIFNLNFEENNADKKYNSLEFLNLSNNKIGKLNSNIFDLLPSIKIIDLTNNNISFYSRYKSLLDISKNNNILILLSKNPGIIKERNREEYCNYLKDILPSISNNLLKNLNLEGLFCGKTYPLLSEINFSNININFNTLNLSCSNLNDQDFVKLIDSHKNAFSRIKKLILCSNYITEVGLDNLINGEYNKIFSDLRKMDLSGNPIKFSDLNMFKKFIGGFPKMKNLIIRHTPIEKDYNNYLKIKVVRKMEENQKKELSNMSEMGLQFEEFVEKEHYLKEKTKLHLKLMNTNGYKYISIIRKYFPYLLDNIKIETKFINEDRLDRIII